MTYQVVSADGATPPYIAEILTASSGETFNVRIYPKVHLKLPGTEKPTVEFDTVSAYLASATDWVKAQSSNIQLATFDEEYTGATLLPGVKNFDTLLMTLEDISAWWEYADELYEDTLVDEEPA